MPQDITLPDSEQYRKQKVLIQPWLVTGVVWVPSLNRLFIPVESEWSTIYIGRTLNAIAFVRKGN